MKNRPMYDSLATWLSVVLLPLSFVLVIIIVGLVLFIDFQPKGRLSCRSFGSYEDMLAAFHNGNPQLDGRDKDRKPCENYFINH